MYTLQPFYQFCDSCKILPWVIYFKETKIKFFKCYNLWFQGTLSMRDVCVDFEPCSKCYSFVPIHSKIIKLGQN